MACFSPLPLWERSPRFLRRVRGIFASNELHKFVVIPKRWVVERSFAWLEKYRRLWKNCERKINTSLQMVVLAFIGLFLKRI